MMEGRRKREEGEMGDSRGNEEEESEGKKVVAMNRELWVEGIMEVKMRRGRIGRGEGK